MFLCSLGTTWVCGYVGMYECVESELGIGIGIAGREVRSVSGTCGWCVYVECVSVFHEKV